MYKIVFIFKIDFDYNFFTLYLLSSHLCKIYIKNKLFFYFFYLQKWKISWHLATLQMYTYVFASGHCKPMYVYQENKRLILHCEYAFHKQVSAIYFPEYRL